MASWQQGEFSIGSNLLGIKKIGTLSQDCFAGRFEANTRQDSFFRSRIPRSPTQPSGFNGSLKHLRALVKKKKNFQDSVMVPECLFVRAPHIRSVFKGLLICSGQFRLETAW